MEAKKAIWEARFKAHMISYIASWGCMMEKLNIYKLAKTREIKTRDLNCVKYIKDEDQRVLVNE
jgi:hypothetical protein